MASSLPVCFTILLSLAAFFVPVICRTRFFGGWGMPHMDGVIFDTLRLAEFPVPSLSKCLLSCSQDARCVSVFYQNSRGQCRLQGGRFYLPQGGREEQGWRYYLMEFDYNCPVMSGYIHRRDLSLCYKLEFQVAATHSQAVSNCTKEGGHLLRIDSQEKQDHVALQLSSSNSTAEDFAQEAEGSPGYFIDGQFFSGRWVWPSTGQNMTFTLWDITEELPEYSADFFVILRSNKNWKWASVFANKYRSYICEKDV